MPLTLAQLVGRYRLLVSDELLAFVERTFVQPAPEPERAAVRADALAEAAAAELVIEPDGTVISRAGAVEFYRIQLKIAGVVEQVRFEKAPGQCVALRLLDPNTLQAVQPPGKPDAVFVRA